MKKMKKFVVLGVISILASIALVACGTSQSTQQATASSQESTSTSATRTVVDQDGTEVEIPQNVEKIADLWHANNQIVLLLGGADKLVATTQFIKDDPWFGTVYPNIKNVTAPFSGNDLQIEELVKLQPDVILTSKDDQVEMGRKAGIPTIKVMFQNFEDMRKTISLTADVIGPDAVEISKKYFDYLDKNIEYVEERTKDITPEERPTVLHIDNNKNLLEIDGTNSMIDEWIQMAGGKNAMSVEGNMVEVTMEEIIKADPDVIIIGSTPTAEALQQMQNDPSWSTLRAVQEGKVYGNPQGTFLWDRYSAEEALQILWAAKLLHPTKFEDLDMVTTTQTFYKTFLNYELTEKQAQEILDSVDPS